MTTREEMVEACEACWDSEVRDSKQWARVLMTVKDASSQLKRDGELRERLAKLVKRWKATEFRCCPQRFDTSCNKCQVREELRDEIESLLKEVE